MTEAFLTMGLTSLQAVLVAANEVPPNAEKAFRSRLAHLQRSGFPAAAAVGRFARAKYGLDELLQLSVVFALVQAYVPPVVGRRLVLDFWPEIARLFLASFDDLGLEGSGRVPNDAPLLMTVLPRALRDIGMEARGHGKGGVNQGGFGIELNRERRMTVPPVIVGKLAEKEVSERDGLELEPAATILIDFRVLTARLVNGIGVSQRPALEASTRNLAGRLGW